MSGTGAFNGDPRLKAQALADLKAGGHPGWNIEATTDEREALAQNYGLTASFLSLVIMPRDAGPREAAISQALSAVEPGADADGIVRDWLLSVWSHPGYGPASRLRQTPAFAPAQAIAEAIRQGGSAPPTAKTWRELRKALLAAGPLGSDQAGYAAVMASMAWDPTTAPTLGGDVWVAWERAVNNERGVAHGWPLARQDELFEALRHCMAQTWKALGAPPTDASPADLAAHEAHVQARTQACMEEKGLVEDQKALFAFFEDEMRPLLADRGPAAFKTILDACARGGRSAGP
ncbi:hypothetical protein [Caulobacter radicis]|uniref:hypothetical protein n=1 Tax=Caulobacter radicis TaxID=2172650 RepID=UPI001403B7C2|nr:hypothetical protein [Caulobacter radicis]